MKQKAFTLAEIMIVLTVIAVLTAILLPSARNAMPNEDLMKFKKAHNALYSAIQELVNSDKYYLDGDLGIKIDGSEVDSPTYFCETLADVMSTKEVNCKDSFSNEPTETWDAHFNQNWLLHGGSMTSFKSEMDNQCEQFATFEHNEIVTPENFTYYNYAPKYTFSHGDFKQTTCISDGTSCISFIPQGMLTIYKVFCLDIDGIGKGKAPFAYGIRGDGKILNGARADEWLQKSIQEKD